jgi:cation transport ATPase
MLESPRVTRILLALTAGGLVGGFALQAGGAGRAANALWIAVSCLALLPLLLDTTRQLLSRHLGVDLIAIVAMVGALAFGEYLAAGVIGLMLSTGAALEQYAAGRAERELSALLKRAPHVAHRVDGAGLRSPCFGPMCARSPLMM